MPRRIVIVGSGGRLGAALVREWRALGDQVTGLSRAQLDLADAQQIREQLEPLDFDVLVNCAALTNVDFCENNEALAFRVNADAVGAMAELCCRKQARCIHISTDYVFDGAKSEAYTEEDVPRPISRYGASKWSGEQQLLAAAASHLAVRVSWVFGPDRPSFLDQILQRALTERRVEAIADKISVPTYTLDAAQLLRPLVGDSSIGGVLHLCNAGACSWQEYGQHALDCAVAAGLSLRARSVEPLRLVEMTSFVARRPIFTPLSTAKLTRLTGLAPRPWREAVADYVDTFWKTRTLGK